LDGLVKIIESFIIIAFVSPNNPSIERWSGKTGQVHK
jgi:hypothetical protein